MSSKEKRSTKWTVDDAHEDTNFVHAGVTTDPISGAILNPIFMSTTFVQESIQQYMAKGYCYSGSGNPTVSAFEKHVAAVENGVGAVAFASGMAAATCAVTSLLKAGDHAILPHTQFGHRSLVNTVIFEDMGMSFSSVDMSSGDDVRRAIIPGKTRMIVSECFSCPLSGMVDISHISAIAKEHSLIHICDSTYSSPVVCRPVDHGADIALKSTSQYYDGHNITTGGALICSNKKHLDRILLVRDMQGSIMTPLVAFYQLQLSKTMPIRVKKQSQNAIQIAAFLESHPKVSKVVYPGLDSFDQKALVAKLHRHGIHGGVLWFALRPRDRAARSKLLNTLSRPWSLCENGGTTESTIATCDVIGLKNLHNEQSENLECVDCYIRLSCGLEHVDELINSLNASLDNL